MSNPELQIRGVRGPPVELISDVQVQGFGAAWDPVQLAYCYDWPSILTGMELEWSFFMELEGMASESEHGALEHVALGSEDWELELVFWHKT